MRWEACSTAATESRIISLPTRSGRSGGSRWGTETHGGFRNVRITDCICTASRGLLMGIVDGGAEDVSVSGITMRDPVNHPLRPSWRAHAGAARHARRKDPADALQGYRDFRRESALPLRRGRHSRRATEDVTLTNVHVSSAGGGTEADAAREPEYRRETSLKVSYLGTLPAVAMMGFLIPPPFWETLRAGGLIHPAVPVPS